MSAWPRSLLPPPVTLHPWSLESLGLQLSSLSAGLATTASAAYPAASTAIFIPFVFTERVTVTKLGVHNGAAVSGNLDAGIYDEAGTLLVSKGSTAQAGTSALQTLDVTDTDIGPGQFFLAVALDNTTGTLFRQTTVGAEMSRTLGIYQMASAFPLPATAVFAAVGQGYIPEVMLLQGRTVL